VCVRVWGGPIYINEHAIHSSHTVRCTAPEDMSCTRSTSCRGIMPSNSSSVQFAPPIAMACSCVHVCASWYARARVCLSLCVCVCWCVCVCVLVFLCVCMHVRLRLCLCLCVRVRACVTGPLPLVLCTCCYCARAHAHTQYTNAWQQHVIM